MSDTPGQVEPTTLQLAEQAQDRQNGTRQQREETLRWISLSAVQRLREAWKPAAKAARR